MRVYVPMVLEGHEWIMPLDPTEFETFFALDGTPQLEWEPPYMTFLAEDDHGRPLRRSDFPWLGEHVFVLRGPALAALRPALDRFGEFLPLRCKEPVSLFNVTTVIDALDENRSRIVRFDDGGILTIEEHVFDPGKIGSNSVFKLPGRASSIYVTHELVEIVRRSGLTGIAFRSVWSDEPVQAAGSIVAFPAMLDETEAKSGLAAQLKAKLRRLIGRDTR